MEIQYKKEKISLTISPYLKKRVNELVDSGDFSSASDLVSTALAEFIGKHDDRTNRKISSIDGTLELLLRGILQTEEGKNFLSSICENESKKKKGEIILR